MDVATRPPGEYGGQESFSEPGRSLNGSGHEVQTSEGVTRCDNHEESQNLYIHGKDAT